MKENSTRSYEIEDAIKYGFIEAVLLHNFRFWITKNKANGKHYYDGNYWTYNSNKAFKDMYPEFTINQIRRALERLIKAGVLIVGNYNKQKFDRTKWYCLNEQMHLAQMPNGSGTDAKPIPDIKTDIKTDDDVVNKKSNVYLADDPEKSDAPPPPEKSLYKDPNLEKEKWLQNKDYDLNQLFTDAIKDNDYINGLMFHFRSFHKIVDVDFWRLYVKVVTIDIKQIEGSGYQNNRKDYRQYVKNKIRRDLNGHKELFNATMVSYKPNAK